MTDTDIKKALTAKIKKYAAALEAFEEEAAERKPRRAYRKRAAAMDSPPAGVVPNGAKQGKPSTGQRGWPKGKPRGPRKARGGNTENADAREVETAATA